MSKPVMIVIAVVVLFGVGFYIRSVEMRLAERPADFTQSIVNTNARIDSALQLIQATDGRNQANTHDILALACVLRPDFSPICQQLMAEAGALAPAVGGEAPQDAVIGVGGEVPLQ